MESIWQDGAALPHYAPLSGDISTDVLIIGGGMAGILCAHQLKKLGVDTVLVEANRLAQGITKNTTAKITAQHGLCYHKLMRAIGTDRTRMYLQANLQALEQFRTLASGIACDFSTQDHHVYSLNNRNALEQELTALQALHYPAEFVESLPLPLPTVGAVKFPEQAQFHPLKFLAVLSDGLPIYEETAVRELGKNWAKCDHGTIHFQKAIVTTHFPFLNKHGSYFLKLYQQRSYVIALENVPEIPGMYLGAEENGLSFRMQGDQLLLGGGGHRTGKQGGNWAVLEDFARTHYPEARITHRWATQDCMSLDGVPYIGRYSRRTPNLFVATGFNKWGMTSSMAAAQLLSDLVLDIENPYTEVFSPSRSMLRKQLAVNGLEATVNLLTPTRKRCPHLGCALKWNPQEHSWDCPCHGSRFEENGTLIDNPATGDWKPPK